jgi:hypothetical protein
MKRSVLLCFTLLLCITSANSLEVEHAKGWGGLDGNDLLLACQAGVEQLNGSSLSVSKAFDAGHCLFYISGFLDGFAVKSERWRSKFACDVLFSKRCQHWPNGEGC